MAISFPTPNLGDPSTLTTTQAGITWTWNDTLKVWSTEGGSSGGGASVSVGENPPTGASQGDLWWNDSVDSYRLFIYTGTEWVDASPQGQEGSGGGLTQAEGDARYLSALSDDTAAGAITFEAGVNVTGGRVLADGSDVQLIRAGANWSERFTHRLLGICCIRVINYRNNKRLFCVRNTRCQLGRR